MRTKRRSYGWVWWLGIAVLVVALVVYARLPKPIEVKVAEAKRGVLMLSLTSTGIVEADLSDVSPKITGRIATLYVEEGQQVDEGVPLAQLEDADLRAAVDRAQAAVTAAERQVVALRTAVDPQAADARAGIDRARAVLEAARHRLADLEAGSRVEDIEAARANLARAQAEAENAHKRYQRAEELLAAGAIAEQDRDTAKAAYDSAQAVVEAQRQQLAALEAGPREQTVEAARADVRAAEAALRQAETALAAVEVKRKEVAAAEAQRAEAEAVLAGAQTQVTYATIRSPVHGVVARKHKELGEVVTPFDPIYTVAALNDIWVTAEVDEEDAAAVEVGQAVSVTLDAYPGRAIKGRVVRVSRIAEPKDVGRVRAKIVRARIHLDSMSIPLRPGMEVNVTGETPCGRATILVPNDALIRIGDEDHVFVIVRGIAEGKRVEVGQSNFEFTQILSGLGARERVAITNVDDLHTGLRVKTVE